MTLSQLQVFVTVVDEGSFTLAAEVIGMTQSAASHALTALETELGVSLLARDRNGVVMTEVGQKIVEQARSMLAQAENIRQQAAASRGLAAGKVRIGSFPSTSTRLLPGIIREFGQQYPGIEIVLFEGTDQEVHQWITDRTVDLGFVSFWADGLETVPLTQDEMVVVLPPGHSLCRAERLGVKSLSETPFILSKSGCELIVTDLFRRAKVSLHARFEASDTTTILAMVQEGLGISIVPALALPTNPIGFEIRRLDPSLMRPLAFGLPSLNAASPATRRFVEQAQSWIRLHHHPTR